MTNHYEAVLAISSAEGSTLHRGTGVLIDGGRYILTAAHLVDGNAQTPTNITIRSQDTSYLPAIKSISVHPDWDSATFNHDIALIELATPITHLQGLPLYRDATPLGAEFVRVGYGDGPDAPQHIGTNIYDATGEVLNAPYNRSIPDGTQLLYDYDNGSEAQNMLNQLTDSHSSSTPTSMETLAISGDSGGPALVDGKIAGIASYVVQDRQYDADEDTPSSPGESGADSNVAAYLPWLDYLMEGNPDYQPPQSPTDVLTQIAEPDFGTVENYFLLSMNTPADETVRLWFSTRDGTATAGEDYEAASGWVEIAAGEQQAAIPVTILGDQAVEGRETLFLDITDPSGQWLGSQTLSASHSILDNDTLL